MNFFILIYWDAPVNVFSCIYSIALSDRVYIGKRTVASREDIWSNERKVQQVSWSLRSDPNMYLISTCLSHSPKQQVPFHCVHSNYVDHIICN